LEALREEVVDERRKPDDHRDARLKIPTAKANGVASIRTPSDRSGDQERDRVANNGQTDPDDEAHGRTVHVWPCHGDGCVDSRPPRSS
jgi:hypothetical protein